CPTSPNVPNSDTADIGAFEKRPKLLLLVTTVNDFGPGSLRQALLDADPYDLTQIDFAPELEGSTISLTNELLLNRTVIINGPGGSGLSLVGAPGKRAMHVTGNITISKLTVRDCQVTGVTGPAETIGYDAYGGAIFNDRGALYLTDMVISN